MNQQEATSFAASLLPCVHCRGPSGGLCFLVPVLREADAEMALSMRESDYGKRLCERKQEGPGRLGGPSDAMQTRLQGRGEATRLGGSALAAAQCQEVLGADLGGEQHGRRGQVSGSLAGTLCRCHRHGPPLVVSLLQTV